MDLDELIEVIKVESGQYEIDLDELDPAKYKLLLKRKVLPVINRYMPYTVDTVIVVSASPYTYITTDIPEWLSNVIPIGNVSTSNIILTGNLRMGRYESGASLGLPLGDISKPTFLWNYQKPKLYIEHLGDMLATECYKAKLTETDTETFSIDLLKEDALPYMIDLLLGYIMVAVGRARRAVTLNDLPIIFDTDTLVSEGQQLILETKEDIKQNSDFELAIGG